MMLFKTTNGNNTNEVEFKTISAVSGATITLSSPLSYQHIAGCAVGNTTSNVVITSYNEISGQCAGVKLNFPNNGQATTGYTFSVVDSEIRNTGATGIFQANSSSVSSSSFLRYFFKDSALINRVKSVVVVHLTPSELPSFDGCVVYCASNFDWVYNSNPISFKRSYIAVGSLTAGSASSVEDCWLNNLGASVPFGLGPMSTVSNTVLSGAGLQISNMGVEFVGCDLGYTYGYNRWFGQGGLTSGSASTGGYQRWAGCLFNPSLPIPDLTANLSKVTDTAVFTIKDKNANSTVQEIYTRRGEVKRDNAVVKSGGSSISSKPIATGRDVTRVQSIQCANGQTIRVVGYVRMDTAFYNGGDCNLPTVSLSGLGATPVTFTATSAANNAWQQYDISITNTAGYDGNFTLTFTANAKTVSTGTVYFDGVPDAPFITKCRHYGFVFNETSPTVQVNPYTVASEATAAAYTGVTINATTKRVTFGAGTIDTLAKLYDYSQAWGCLNIDKDMPWTRAGALLSLATGWTIVEPTIPGVTWGGGNVEFGAPGAINQSFDSSNITFTAAGTYNMGGGVFAGAVEFINTSGGAVTVRVPAGASYTNTGPNITVELPTGDVDIVAAALIAGSRVRLYNVTDATEIYNAVLPSTGLVHTLTYSADKVVVLRADHATKLPLEVAGVLTASGLTFLDVQQEDVVYVGNAIDGSAVTEFVADEPNVEVDIDDLDGSTSFRRLYAWMQHYFTTEAGIRSSMFGAVTAFDSGTYVINTAKADILLDNVGVLPVAFMNGDRLIRSDGTSVIAPTSGTIHIDSGFVPVVETGVSGLTATESERLLALDTTYLDAPVSSRLAAASYTAPDNAGIADIDAKTDALATLVADVVDGVEASTVLAKEATAAKAVQNAALAVALGA